MVFETVLGELLEVSRVCAGAVLNELPAEKICFLAHPVGHMRCENHDLVQVKSHATYLAMIH